MRINFLKIRFSLQKNNPHFKIQVVLKFYGNKDDVGDKYKDDWIQKDKLKDFFLTLWPKFIERG
ncbi:hypothetical protein HpMS86_07060 [Helicobacter pylori]